MDDVMLEVERLWPPFFGGGRMCTQVLTDGAQLYCDTTC